MWHDKNGERTAPKEGDLVKVTMHKKYAAVELLSYDGPLDAAEVPLYKREGNLLDDTYPLFSDPDCKDTIIPATMISEGFHVSRALAKMAIGLARLNIAEEAVEETEKIRIYLVVPLDLD